MVTVDQERGSKVTPRKREGGASSYIISMWGSNSYTPGSGPSALLAGVLCALPGLVHQLYWLGFCVHSRVWSISSIGWGSVCTCGSGPSALLAGVLCTLPGLVHRLYWLGFCVRSRVWSISSIGWSSVCTPGSSPSALLAGVTYSEGYVGRFKCVKHTQRIEPVRDDGHIVTAVQGIDEQEHLIWHYLLSR